MGSQSPCLIILLNQGVVSFLHQLSILTDTGGLAISSCSSENNGAEQVSVLKIYINFRESCFDFVGSQSITYTEATDWGSAASVLLPGGLSTLEVPSCIVYIPEWVNHTSSRLDYWKELRRENLSNICVFSYLSYRSIRPFSLLCSFSSHWTFTAWIKKIHLTSGFWSGQIKESIRPVDR